MIRRKALVGFLSVAMVAISLVATADAGAGSELRQYRVTVENLTTEQPMSPPVLATFDGNRARAFRVGDLATPEIRAIAEDGNQNPQFDKWSNDPRVTDAINGTAPLGRSGVVGGPPSAQTHVIEAYPGDRLGLATMLICTNDGFVGLSSVKLPNRGSSVFLQNGYDAGTEENTEVANDIVEPCSILGPAELPNRPSPNSNPSTVPPQPIALHPNVQGVGDLTPGLHGWNDPVLKVTVTRIDDNATRFQANLTGEAEVPPVDTEASGRARFELLDNDVLSYRIDLEDIDGVVAAHIHAGEANDNGPIAAFLFGGTAPTGEIDGRLINGAIVPGTLFADGPFAGDFPGFIEALRNGELYVNVHTVDNPPGELRGQIGMR